MPLGTFSQNQPEVAQTGLSALGLFVTNYMDGNQIMAHKSVAQLAGLVTYMKQLRIPESVYRGLRKNSIFEEKARPNFYFVGATGESGGGKSTMFRLLFRFFDVREG